MVIKLGNLLVSLAACQPHVAILSLESQHTGDGKTDLAFRRLEKLTIR